MTATCETCRFWQPYERQYGEKRVRRGECRQRAPHPPATADEELRGWVETWRAEGGDAMTLDPFAIPRRFDRQPTRRLFLQALDLLERRMWTPAMAWWVVQRLDELDELHDFCKSLPDDDGDGGALVGV